MIAHYPSERGAVVPVIVEDEAAKCLLDSLEVEEYQRLISINQHLGVAKADPIVCQVPRRKICTRILNRFHSRELSRDFLKVSLIGKSFAVNVVVTPFDTFGSPPSNRRQTV